MDPDETLDTRLNLLKLIILNDDSVKAKLSEAWKKFNNNIFCDMTFEFYRTSYEWEDYCDCWYTNEYFEYINTDIVDLKMFESVTDNIRKSRCPHVEPEMVGRVTSWTGISLIHAATAVGNKTIIKYLLTIDKRSRFHTTNAAKLPPMIIAVLKNRPAIIKRLHVEVLDLSYSHYHSFSNRVKRTVFNKAWYEDDGRVNLCGMVAASRGTVDNVVTIKRRLSYFEEFQNPYVLISYAGVAPNEPIIDAMRRYLNEDEMLMVLQNAIYRHTSDEATNIVSHVSNYSVHFTTELVLECILWNNIESLDIVLKKLKAETLQYEGYSFVSIAEFLKHNECARVLQDFCSTKLCVKCRSKPLPASKRRFAVGASQKEKKSNTESLDPNESPFTVVVKLSKQRGYDTESMCKLLQKICTKLCDINFQNKYGMTPVHICLEGKIKAKCLRAILETLFRKGADANIQDINGRSALYSSLSPYNSPMGYGSNIHHVISTMKIVLYHNAVPAYNETAVHHAISRDKMNSFLLYVNDSSATVIFTKNSVTAQNDIEKEVIVETTRDKFLALSFVAILIELGFPIQKSTIPLLNDLPSELRRYVNETMCTPRSLQASCRNVIRKAYPGPELQRFLEVVNIPDAIADLLLFKPYLLRTKICLPSGTCVAISHTSNIEVNALLFR